MMLLMRISGRSWLAIALALSVIHHVDHVLRYDHSGWPFKAETTVFTYTLAIYPALAIAFAAPVGSILRVAIVGAGLAMLTLAHTFVETPYHQFSTWAYKPDTNLLGWQSPLIGSIAVVVSVALSVTALFSLICFASDLRHSGRSPTSQD